MISFLPRWVKSIKERIRPKVVKERIRHKVVKERQWQSLLESAPFRLMTISLAKSLG
jgi:hypothetical protein